MGRLRAGTGRGLAWLVSLESAGGATALVRPSRPTVPSAPSCDLGREPPAAPAAAPARPDTGRPRVRPRPDPGKGLEADSGAAGLAVAVAADIEELEVGRASPDTLAGWAGRRWWVPCEHGRP